MKRNEKVLWDTTTGEWEYDVSGLKYENITYNFDQLSRIGRIIEKLKNYWIKIKFIRS